MPRTRAHTSRILYRTQKGWRDAFACGIWTREVFIKALGDFGSRKNYILAVGCPASEYYKNKPQELEPIYLPNKETRPKDPIFK